MKIGEFNSLSILRFTSVGAYLGDDEDNEVLLPNKYLNDGLELDEVISVFVYRDSEDRPVATTEIPYILLNEYAFLKTTEVNYFGAFMDWGLEKELLVPFKEQNLKLEEGRYYLTTLLLDESTDRVFGSTRVHRYLKSCERTFAEDEQVELLICETTDLGVKVIVDKQYSGLIFRSDISKPIKRGQIEKGFVTKVREDGKLDIRLDLDGYKKIDASSERLLNIFKTRGELSLTDKSDPDLIRETVGMSKKTFKKAVGNLYKNKLITMDESKITYIGD